MTLGTLRHRKLNTWKDSKWEDQDTRRQFLRSFAEKMGFDPMIKANWKGTSSKLLVSGV